MTIPFKKLKARLLTNPKIKAEYDALAPELGTQDHRRVAQGLSVGGPLPRRAGCSDGHRPVHDRST
jgi:hypothetical protein